MLKALQAIFLILLLATAAMFTYVIMKPAESKRALRELVRGKPAPPPPTPTPTPAPVEVAADTAPEPDATPAPRETPKPPPSRAEIEERRRREAELLGKAGAELRRANAVGAQTAAVTTPPPAPELYPLGVTRRTFPTPEIIRVELNVKNASGIFWSNAYITLKSATHPDYATFQIADWRIDEVVALDYTFAASELEDRLRELRVVRVDGIARESALSGKVNRAREEFADSLGGPRDDADRRRIRVPGLMGLITAARGAELGYSVEILPVDRAMAESLTIAIPQSLLISETYQPPIVADTVYRQQSVAIYERAYNAAVETQRAAVRMVELLNEKGDYAGGMNAGGEDLRRRVASSLVAFSNAAIEHVKFERSAQDARVTDTQNALNRVTAQLNELVSSVETQTKKLNPNFAFE